MTINLPVSFAKKQVHYTSLVVYDIFWVGSKLIYAIISKSAKDASRLFDRNLESLLFSDKSMLNSRTYAMFLLVLIASLGFICEKAWGARTTGKCVGDVAESWHLFHWLGVPWSALVSHLWSVNHWVSFLQRSILKPCMLYIHCCLHFLLSLCFNASNSIYTYFEICQLHQSW